MVRQSTTQVSPLAAVQLSRRLLLYSCLDPCCCARLAAAPSAVLILFAHTMLAVLTTSLCLLHHLAYRLTALTASLCLLPHCGHVAKVTHTMTLCVRSGDILSTTGGHADDHSASLECLGACDAPIGHLCDGVPECIKAVRLQLRKGVCH